MIEIVMFEALAAYRAVSFRGTVYYAIQGGSIV